MASFLRLLLGVALLPACWGATRVFFKAIAASAGAGDWVSAEVLSLLGGILAFTVAWFALSHPVRVVIVCALVVYAFVRPLPFLPLWLFLVGFTWAFHVLFTLETLGQRQPDVRPYGRVFAWTFIYLVNLAIVLVWLASTTPFNFTELGLALVEDVTAAYVSVVSWTWAACRWTIQKCTQS